MRRLILIVIAPLIGLGLGFASIHYFGEVMALIAWAALLVVYVLLSRYSRS